MSDHDSSEHGSTLEPASHDESAQSGPQSPRFTTPETLPDQQPQGTNRKIVLHRFVIYNSLHTMYIVGSNTTETLFRIMEISKSDRLLKITIVEDANVFYTRKDMGELMEELHKTLEGGIRRVAKGYGLLGLVRFTRGYYLSLITKCLQVAVLGGHFVYHITETAFIPLDFAHTKPRKGLDEERLLAIYNNLDLSKTFYFSYTYDITNTLQTICVREKMRARKHAELVETGGSAESPQLSLAADVNTRFVWNAHLLAPVHAHFDSPSLVHDWFLPIIHGFVDQACLLILGRKVYLTLIARRLQHFAGARFLKRGVNMQGNVANEVETEQIVCDQLHTLFHDPKYGFYNNRRVTLFVQHRGSIPLHWTQDMSRLPKPPIEISLLDPFYQCAALHFDNLFKRYGAPVYTLDLVKTKERTPRESKLSVEYARCIQYLNQFLPPNKRMVHTQFDMSRVSKKEGDVITPLEAIGDRSIASTRFFHNGQLLETTQLQQGVNRTNCIDCLDRTNAAQFILGKTALSYQLHALGFIAKPRLAYDLDVVNILTEMFHDHGDTIALQYGGLHLVNTMDLYRKINQWLSHTRDSLNSIKRMYANSFVDGLRQEAINLFLGNYVYDERKLKLWELLNDFWLHNDGAMMLRNFGTKTSYTHWFNSRYLAKNSSAVELAQKLAPHIPLRPRDDVARRVWEHTDHHQRFEKLEPYPGNMDTWWNEAYAPRRFTSFEDMYQFTMNLTERYFPSKRGVELDFSPFDSRKETVLLAGDGPLELDADERRHGWKLAGILRSVDSALHMDLEVRHSTPLPSSPGALLAVTLFSPDLPHHHLRLRGFLRDRVERYFGTGPGSQPLFEMPSRLDTATPDDATVLFLVLASDAALYRRCASGTAAELVALPLVAAADRAVYQHLIKLADMDRLPLRATIEDMGSVLADTRVDWF